MYDWLQEVENDILNKSSKSSRRPSDGSYKILFKLKKTKSSEGWCGTASLKESALEEKLRIANY